MIKAQEPKVKESLQCMHDAMQRKVKKGIPIKENIVIENRIFSILCSNFNLCPTKTAIAMNDKYGYEMTGDEVIRIFRRRRMANPNERKELLEWADSVAVQFAGALEGKKEAYDEFEKIRKKPALKNGKKHDSQERMAAIMIYTKYPEIDLFNDIESLHLLGNTLAKYYFYDISDSIREVYGFPQYRETHKKKPAVKENEKKLTYEQTLKRIDQLENTLERTNTMLQDLQAEFQEQLEASKLEELADFFAKLNSEKYGCILDELLVVRKGVDELRKSNYELPIEINGLLIMVKKLIQFVKDSHIEPMMKINSIREVIASDVEFCNYEGTPFNTPDEKKIVKIISPGWIYRDKELQISRPKVKEEE